MYVRDRVAISDELQRKPRCSDISVCLEVPDVDPVSHPFGAATVLGWQPRAGAPGKARTVDRPPFALTKEAAMAKGQKRSTREPKKPKTAVKKPAAGATSAPYQLPVRPAPAKSGGK